MFEKDAIGALSKAEAISAAMNSLMQAHANNEDLAALPEEFKIHDLEQFMVARRRARGSMTTQALGDFAAYVKTHAENGATVFVTPENMAAVAVLNLGTPEVPGHADNRATYSPPKLAAYKSMLAISERHLDQQAAAEWLEDWPGMWQAFHDTEQLTAPATVAAVRKITIEALAKAETSAGQLSAEKSTFEQVKASSGANKLPTHLHFKCAPYLGIEERTYVLRLSIRTGNKDPLLALRIVNKEQHDEQIGQELAEKVRQAIGDTAPVHLGTYTAK